MFARNFISHFIVILLVFAIAGCSGGGAKPVAPDVPGEPLNAALDEDSSRVLWGVWSIEFDPAEMKVVAKPLRNGQPHFNLTPMLLPPACDDCVAIALNAFDPVTRIMDLDVTLRNPHPISGKDVRGILYTNDYGHLITNPDGWTNLFDALGGEDINPFIAYAKDEPNRVFAGEAEHAENFLVYIPKPPQYSVITFAVEASWPGNCKEPYSIENFMQIGEMYDLTGAAFDIQVEVFDWQDDVDFVKLTAPALTGAEFNIFDNISGNLWGATLSNSNYLDPGDHDFLLTARSADTAIQMHQYVTITISDAPAPTITSIEPDIAYPGDNLDDITIYGTNFFGQFPDVSLAVPGWGDIPGTDVNVGSSTTVTCDIEIGWDVPITSYGVEISYAGGPSGLASDLFDVLCPIPVFTDMDPNSGYQGTTLYDVAITGEYFIGPNIEVKLLSPSMVELLAQDVVQIDTSNLTCTIPIPLEAEAGLYYIEITNDCGETGSGEAVFEVMAADPANPVDITPDYLNFAPKDVVINGNYAYVAGSDNGVHIFDVFDPINPVWLKRIPTIQVTEAVAYQGGYLFVASGVGDLQIMDVDPVEDASIVKEITFDGMAYDVVVDGDYAYVAARYGATTFHIVDISDIPTASVVKSVLAADDAWGVDIESGYAFIADGDDYFTIVDIDPVELAYLAYQVPMPDQARKVDVENGYAYVACMGAGIQVVDVDPPELASIVDAIDTGGSALDVTFFDGHVYVADDVSGMRVIDVDPIGSGVEVDDIYFGSGAANGVTVAGNYAYVADAYLGLAVVNIVDPTNVSWDGMADTFGHSQGVAADSNYVYLADFYAGLRIFDATFPEMTMLMNTVYTGSTAYDVFLDNGIAFVANGHGGNKAIDIDPPESAFIAESIPGDGNIVSCVVYGEYAYVAAYYDGLHIIDIDPLDEANIVITVDTPGRAFDVDVKDGYAYIADYTDGLQVIDIDPVGLAGIVHNIPTTNQARGVYVDGDYAYWADGGNGIQIVDITAPESAWVVKNVDTNFACDVVVRNGYAYVADGSYGLKVVDVDPVGSAYIYSSCNTPGSAQDVYVYGNNAYLAAFAGGLRIIELW